MLKENLENLVDYIGKLVAYIATLVEYYGILVTDSVSFACPHANVYSFWKNITGL